MSVHVIVVTLGYWRVVDRKSDQYTASHAGGRLDRTSIEVACGI
jgi:hypothetical protein